MSFVAALPAMSQAIGGMGMEGISKSEYRYWNFVMGVNFGIGGTFGKSDPSMYLKTNVGDVAQEKKGFTITPGYHVGFVYNYDLLNNRMGVVAGSSTSIMVCKTIIALSAIVTPTNLPFRI
jgi:hypothetical protein